jgi:endonuclease/exonuclease/phosphatase family metal-dependent hydrolase
MGWLFLVLLISVTTAVSSVRDDPAAATAQSGRLRVATFNIHKGADRRGRYDLQRTIEALARFEADLIGVQEAMRNDAAFDCDDQPALIADGLSRLTGRPWTHVYAKAWVTTDRECLRRGEGDDAASEGLALFAPSRIVGVAALRLSRGRIGLTGRLASLPLVTVVLTHLSANRENQPDRVREILALLPWTERRRVAILMGDLNARPPAIELAPVFARYRDAWLDAAEHGATGGIESGATRPGRTGARIDYVFYAANAGLTVESVDVVDTSGPPGLPEVSDHRPVVATFRLAGGGPR